MDGYRTPGGVRIPEAAVRFTFARSGGAGGQHVNTASTKVRVAIDLEACGLRAERRERLVAALGPRVTASAETYRSQWRNRQAALDTAFAKIDGALAVRTPRRPTRPSKGATERRLADKARRSRQKSERATPPRD